MSRPTEVEPSTTKPHNFDVVTPDTTSRTRYNISELLSPPRLIALIAILLLVVLYAARRYWVSVDVFTYRTLVGESVGNEHKSFEQLKDLFLELGAG